MNSGAGALRSFSRRRIKAKRRKLGRDLFNEVEGVISESLTGEPGDNQQATFLWHTDVVLACLQPFLQTPQPFLREKIAVQPTSG